MEIDPREPYAHITGDVVRAKREETGEGMQTIIHEMKLDALWHATYSTDSLEDMKCVVLHIIELMQS